MTEENNERLKSFINRIERLEDEKSNTQNDIKEVYKEAKMTGFDTKVLKEVIKLRKLEEHERLEKEAILETYMKELGMPRQSSMF